MALKRSHELQYDHSSEYSSANWWENCRDVKMACSITKLKRTKSVNIYKNLSKRREGCAISDFNMKLGLLYVLCSVVFEVFILYLHIGVSIVNLQRIGKGN